MRLEPFAELLAQTIGLDAASLGERGLARAVETAMAGAGVTDPDAYLGLLASSPEAMAALIRETVVPETWFFRDGEPFRCLREHLRTLKRRGTTPRLLSAPCATGEEAYSIAITCLEAGLPPGGFELVGVDINAESLAVARRGQYGRNSFRDDLGQASHRFQRQGDDARTAVMSIRPEVADTVTFVKDNIVGERFLSDAPPFDVIFSRNLLIYLNIAARKRLVANIDRLLAPDGLLFVGHSEIQSFLAAGYRSVPHPRAFACRRDIQADPLPTTLIRPPAAAPAPPTRPGTTFPGKWTSPLPRAAQARSATSGRLPHPRPEMAGPAAERPDTATIPGEEPLRRARRLADQGDLTGAAALCRRHLEVNRDSAEAYYLLGLVGAAEQRVDEARTLFQKALYLEPGHAACLAHLALIHDQLGDVERANLYRKRLKRLSDTGGGRP